MGQRQVLSPTEIPPPPKLPQCKHDGTDFADPEHIDVPIVTPQDHKMSNHSGQHSTFEKLPQSKKVTLQVRPSRRRSLTLTSPPDLDLLSLTLTSPPDLKEEPSSSDHSQPSMSGALEKRTGYERLSNDKVGELVSLLESAGAISRINVYRKKSTFSKLLHKMSRITFDESSERVTEYEPVASKSVDEVRVLCCSDRLTYFNKLRKEMEKRLISIDAPLYNTPDEAMALSMQLREMAMFQMAGSRILFLDGGGLRGLIQIEILSQVENQLSSFSR